MNIIKLIIKIIWTIFAGLALIIISPIMIGLAYANEDIPIGKAIPIYFDFIRDVTGWVKK